MPEFKIEIKETLSRTVEVQAKSLEHALEIVSKQYNDEIIVLDSDDFVAHSIEPFEFEEQMELF